MGQVVATFPNRETKTWATKAKTSSICWCRRASTLKDCARWRSAIARGGRHGFWARSISKGGPSAVLPGGHCAEVADVLLMLFVASLLPRACARRAARRRPADRVLVWTGVSGCSRCNRDLRIGERHILPLYPFALLIAGGIWQNARQDRLGNGRGDAVALSECRRRSALCAPDYLAYFKYCVKPQNSWRLLTDSNLDWGQGLMALRNYEQQHPDETLRLAYFGSVDATLYGIKAKPLPPGAPVRGKVVTGASCLSGQVLDDPSGYRWLWPYQPRHVLDHAMWMFDTGER